MPFWNRRRNETVEVAYIEQTANQAQQDLASGEDPRSSIAVEMMLKWLWNLDNSKTRAMQRVLGAPDLAADDYTRFVQQLAPPFGQEPPLEPFPIVAGLIRDLIESCLTKEQTPLRVDRENFVPNRIILENSVAMVGKLQIYEAHDIICRLLAAANYRIQKRGQGPISNHPTAVNPESSARNLVKLTTDCLLALPPDHIPDFWARLKALSTVQDLRPVVARMRDRRAVPYMLEVLPHLESDPQCDVIIALANIKDVRAVPALQELAGRMDDLVAPRAAFALAEILRTSQDDSAQLLRASDARNVGNAAEILLRAAGPTPETTVTSDQLLRAGQAPPGEMKEPAQNS